MTTRGAVRLLAIGLAVFGLAGAGELEPPAPPAPTMASLATIYDKAGDCGGGGICGVIKTGQTTCSDLLGGTIDCAGTGQDGDHPSGRSANPRFTDNADGTVTDNLTRLTWLKDGTCFGPQYWPNALSDAGTLQSGNCGLTDGSAAGDWRLPNVNELRSLLDYGQGDPALPASHPFVGVLRQNFWSSTTDIDSTTLAWVVSFASGEIFGYDKNGFAGPEVWPVRGAP